MQKLERIIVAVDGPAGSGKSSVCSGLAQALGWDYVNTGAIYRSIAFLALQNDVSVSNDVELVSLISGLGQEIEWKPETRKIHFRGQDISGLLHTLEVSDAASAVAKLPGVRSALLQLQRTLGLRSGVAAGCVVEGRDIGTVVFPDAPLKIFLTASLEERARRRSLQLQSDDTGGVVATVQQAIAARDAADVTRQSAPLRQAEDAILFDTTGKSLDQVVAELTDVIRVKFFS